MYSSCRTCAVLTIVLAFPVAVLLGIFFSSGGEGGVAVAMMCFVILEGGFLIFAVFGAAAGVVAHKIAKQSKLSPVAIRLGASLVAAVVGWCVLASAAVLLSFCGAVFLFAALWFLRGRG